MKKSSAKHMNKSISILLLTMLAFQTSLSGELLSQKDYLSVVLPPALIRYANIEIPAQENLHIQTNSAGRFLDFCLLPGQARKNNGIRSEISVDYPFKAGEVVRYQWKMLLPEDFKPDAQNRWWVMGQWHDQPNKTRGETWDGFPSRSPPVSFVYGRVDGKDILSVMVGSPKMKSIGLVPVSRNAWHSLEVIIRWSQEMDGRVAVFLDGSQKPVASGTGPNMHNDYQHYLKLGMYRHPEIATENHLAIRDVLITTLKEWPVVEK